MERSKPTKTVKQSASKITREERRRNLRDMSPEGIARRQAEAELMYEERRRADLIAAGGRC